MKNLLVLWEGRSIISWREKEIGKVMVRVERNPYFYMPECLGVTV